MKALPTTWTYVTLRFLHLMSSLRPSLEVKSSLFLSLESSTSLRLHLSQEPPNSFRPNLEPPNFLHPNLERPISFCHRLEPQLLSYLHPSLEPLSSLHLILEPPSYLRPSLDPPISLSHRLELLSVELPSSQPGWSHLAPSIATWNRRQTRAAGLLQSRPGDAVVSSLSLELPISLSSSLKPLSPLVLWILEPRLTT